MSKDFGRGQPVTTSYEVTMQDDFTHFIFNPANAIEVPGQTHSLSLEEILDIADASAAQQEDTTKVTRLSAYKFPLVLLPHVRRNRYAVRDGCRNSDFGL